MKPLQLIVLFLLIGTSSLAQSSKPKFKKPDYPKIEKAIQKKNSPLYYPALIKRFEQGDTTFTILEKRHLYYGYQFQPNYKPYSTSDLLDGMLAILQKTQQTDAELRQVVQNADSVFMEYPFSVLALNFQLHALKLLGQVNLYHTRLRQLFTVLDAIASTGDGITKRTAIFVIDPSHEYAIVNLLGFEFAGSQYLTDHFDFLEIKPNEAKLRGLYFDVSPSLHRPTSPFK